MDALLSAEELPTTNRMWGRPTQPTPGSKFTMPSNPLGDSTSNGTLTLDGNFFNQGGRVSSRLSNVRDAQMKAIPNRHAEKRTGSRGGNLFDTTPGGGSMFGGMGEGSGGVFGSIANANGGSAMQTMTLAPSGRSSSGGINGIHTLGTLGFVTSSMDDEDEQNTVSGFHSNGQIVGPEYLILTPPGIECPGDGDILIQEDLAYDRNLHSNSTFFQKFMTDLQGRGQNFAGHYGYHLAGFNYHIASLQQHSGMNSLQQCYNLFKVHRNIITRFSVLGVINSEINASGGASFLLDSSTSAGNGNNSKSVNVVGEGEVMIKNIFGPVKAGDDLWFIWKKVPMPEYFLPDTRTDRSSALSGNGGNRKFIIDGKQQTNYSSLPFQLIPYCHPRHRSPPLEEMEYISDHEGWYQPAALLRNTKRGPFKHHGIAIYIGQVTQPQRSIAYSDAKRAVEFKSTCNQAAWDYTIGNNELIGVLINPRMKKYFERISGRILDKPSQNTAYINTYEPYVNIVDDTLFPLH
jgi:hypothetical protein